MERVESAVTRTRPPSRLPARFRQLRAAILQKSPRFAHFRRTSANIPHVFPHNIPHNQETPAAWDCRGTAGRRGSPPPGRLGSRKPGAFPFYGSSKIFNFIAAAPFFAVQNVQFLRHFVSFYIINTIRHIMTYTHPGSAPRLTSHVSERTDV